MSNNVGAKAREISSNLEFFAKICISASTVVILAVLLGSIVSSQGLITVGLVSLFLILNGCVLFLGNSEQKISFAILICFSGIFVYGIECFIFIKNPGAVYRSEKELVFMYRDQGENVQIGYANPFFSLMDGTSEFAGLAPLGGVS
jgi:hypothetical protein